MRQRKYGGNAKTIGKRTAYAESVAETADDNLASYTQALLDLFTRSNSILTGQPVDCVVSDITQIACTDGETVYFNPNILRKAFEGADKGKLNVKKALEVLSHVRGVNLHELAHILYSPRSGSVTWNSVIKLQHDIEVDQTLAMKFYGIKAFTVWNLLEDQRIESLFSSKYRNSIAYFQQTITKLILEDPKAKVELMHLWIHGRRYMPRDIRGRARAVFQKEYKVSDEDMKLWESLIDDYRKLVFPRDGRKVASMVSQFMELWAKYIKSDMPDDYGTTGGQGKGGHGERREGNADSYDQHEAQEWMEEVDEASEESENGSSNGDGDESDDEESESKDSDDSKVTEGSGSGEFDEEADGESENGSPSESSSSGKSSETSDDSNGGSGGQGETDAGTSSPNEYNEDATGGGLNSGAGGGGEWGTSQNGLLNALEDTLARASESVKGDLMDTIQQVLRKVDGISLDKLFRGVEKPESYVAPTPKFRSITNSLNATLRMLRSDADSMWERGVPTGRLNIDLVVKSEATEQDMDVFDQWVDSGDDAPRVEVVILLDQSQSMATSIPTSQSSGLYNTMAEASACVWSIKVACQQNEIPCTVIGYSDTDSTALLYTADMRINPQQVGLFQYKGNTQPEVALKIASQVFDRSEADNKILISISDGEWSFYNDEQRQMAILNGIGVDSIFVALPSRYRVTGYDEKGHYIQEPQFASGLDRTNGYGHKQLLKVANPTELAKRIGKAIVRASL